MTGSCATMLGNAPNVYAPPEATSQAKIAPRSAAKGGTIASLNMRPPLGTLFTKALWTVPQPFYAGLAVLGWITLPDPSKTNAGPRRLLADVQLTASCASKSIPNTSIS